MTAKPHKSGYGKMFPSTLSLGANEPIQGKAFSVFGGKPHGTVVTGRRVEVNMEQWDDCLACEEFENCRKLSQARLSLERAVMLPPE